MGSLLSYSGLTTKIRAMQSRLLPDDQYRELAELKSGKIEQLLVNSIYRDFTKIYQFSNMEQRKFLNLYFGRYEVSIMKECLNKIFDHRDVNLDLSLFKPFFDKHSQLDINLLTASRKTKDKILSKRNLEEITKAYGNKFDLLNLQWIYRSKQYYHMTAADIYALLIPVNYKLHKKDIAALVEAETMTAFESLLDRTYYGRRYEKLNSQRT